MGRQGVLHLLFVIAASATRPPSSYVRRRMRSGASGVVAVDPLHSLGIWGMQTLLQPYFVARGDVHVGVAASRDVVERLLKGANPTRYASLDVPVTPDATNQILAGVGALLHQHPDSLLPGVRVKHAILGGWSQTAVVTRSFISSRQGTATIDGHRVFDGYFPGQAAVGSSGGAQVGRLPDIGVPVLELQGERELLVTLSVYGNLGYRRRDSKTYRLYEVAAMSHINNEPDNPISAFAGSLTCDWPAGATPSVFRQTDIWEMAFDNLDRWIAKGVRPPHARRIRLEADGRHGQARRHAGTPSAACAASSSTCRPRASCRRALPRRCRGEPVRLRRLPARLQPRPTPTSLPNPPGLRPDVKPTPAGWCANASSAATAVDTSSRRHGQQRSPDETRAGYRTGRGAVGDLVAALRRARRSEGVRAPGGRGRGAWLARGLRLGSPALAGADPAGGRPVDHADGDRDCHRTRAARSDDHTPCPSPADQGRPRDRDVGPAQRWPSDPRCRSGQRPLRQ